MKDNRNQTIEIIDSLILGSDNLPLVLDCLKAVKHDTKLLIQTVQEQEQEINRMKDNIASYNNLLKKKDKFNWDIIQENNDLKVQNTELKNKLYSLLTQEKNSL